MTIKETLHKHQGVRQLKTKINEGKLEVLEKMTAED